ncbi:MAG: glycosyltransferase family 9 protein [Ignavibacteria bacterium]|nr:glycosyltransferase family 9 protein [Ignavibacteria bacterium]
MKILINALSGNGDALMFSPALRLLKNKLPDSEIDMLVMFRSVREMYAENPWLNKIHYIDLLNQSKFKSFREIRKLKNNNYDFSVNVYPSNRFEYNLLNALLGAKSKLAHHYIHTDIFRAEYFNDILINEVKNRHNVLQNMDLISQIVKVNESETGRMEIFISGEDKVRSDKWHMEINPEKKTIAGFHPGSALLKNHINKRWDKDKFAELGCRLMDEFDVMILLFGNEFELNNEINALMHNRAVIASTSNYMDSVARMVNCKLFVSNDTAFMHTAAALQIPVAAIFGYTNAEELSPWMTDNVVIRKNLDCSPCFYNSPKPADCIWKGAESFKCIKSISVDEVFEACIKLLKKNQTLPS